MVPGLEGENVFQCFWSDPKTRMFLGVFEPASVFFRGGRWPARGRPAPDPIRLPPLRRRVIDVFIVANIMWRINIISRIGTHLVESEIDLLRVHSSYSTSNSVHNRLLS